MPDPPRVRLDSAVYIYKCLRIYNRASSLFWASLLDSSCSANRLNAISEVAHLLSQVLRHCPAKKGMMPYYHLKNFTA